ncbi:MAG: TetR/AcrR family transcriptional regulator [Bacteroidaceae bacterium]|nr:TetR/AcrR family transcriptional regulator [Bacteroidaceae bacterium]MEA5100329.1 TetR/AcrR family transcriptional regulator [Bacteroidales bacterium]
MKKGQESSKKVSMEITILKVAEELFVEKGYSATSTVEIASKAGCNQALVHYYFRTKSNLFNKILESKISFMVSAFDYIDNNELSFTENLTKTIEMHFDALTKDKKLPIFVLNEIKNNDNNNVLDIIREIFRNKISFLLTKLDAILQEEIKAKRIREISALDLVLTIVSLNIFVFLAYPIVDYVLSVNEKGVELIIQQRKKEIVNTILNSLRP